MPFGLTNAPATFQRVMDTALAGLKWKCCLVYLDDIVVFSKSFEDHIEDLEQVFERLRQAKLTLKAKKCHLCCQQITYLGHLITKDGIREDPDKFATIAQFPIPRKGDKKALMSFLGVTGHFQKFIKDYHIIVEPLRDLLKEGNTWEWTAKQDQAFQDIKRLLTEQGGPVLTLPDLSGRYPFSLHCDASDNGLGAVLYQKQPNGSDKVIQYASRTLSNGERKWHTTEKEALAIIWACEKFAPYLMGPKFTVVTDHASLQWLWDYKKGRLARGLSELANSTSKSFTRRVKKILYPTMHLDFPKDNILPDMTKTGLLEDDEGRLEHAMIAMIASSGNQILVGCNNLPILEINSVIKVIVLTGT
jgi:hypothetical protein